MTHEREASLQLPVRSPAAAASSDAAPELADDAEARAIIGELCGSLAVASDDYQARRFETGMQYSCKSGLTGLVEGGSVGVSRTAWPRCKAYAQALKPPIGHELRDAEACRAVFVPRLEMGDRCHDKLECPADAYCDDLETHQCVPRITRGSRCHPATLTGDICEAGSFCRADTCAPLEKAGARCSGHCEKGLFCVNGACRASRAARGERCYPQDQSCGVGLRCAADLVCRERETAGTPCAGADDCASGACVTGPSGPSVCR